jgi:hypothetical protein
MARNCSTSEPANPGSPRPGATWRDSFIVFALLLLVWLAFNYLTLDRYPVVWIYEVSYADPAVNLTVLIGPLLHGGAALYDWPYRAPSIPEALVARNVQPRDRAYTDQEVYYALRRHGLVPYVGYYIDAMTAEERERTSILFIKPERLEWAAARLGGRGTRDEFKPLRMGFLGTHWDLGFLSAFNYHLAVYRRDKGEGVK